MKRSLILIVIMILMSSPFYGQGQKIEVLTLGTFHFSFPNRDIKKTEDSDQINVLDPKYQDEIEDIVTRIAKFKPTIIAIERDPDQQSKYDSLYFNYLINKYTLKRSEDEQIGFRLAKLLSIKKLYCVNAWGHDYENLNIILEGKDSTEQKKFWNFFYKNPDTLLNYYPKPIFKTQSILAELRRVNTDSTIKKDLGNYLIGVFKYETNIIEYSGPDFVTGWWFNRNLRIFRNIQKLDAKPKDRILIIFGAGHLNLLNLFFNSSPEYKLVDTNVYLK